MNELSRTVKELSLSEKSSILNEMLSLSPSEIDLFGKEKQKNIDENLQNIMSDIKCLDFDEYGKKVLELRTFADSSTNKVAVASPLLKLNKFLRRYSTMESQLNGIVQAFEDRQNYMREQLNALYLAEKSMESSLNDFHSDALKLEVLTVSLLESKENGELEDTYVLQSASNRLKVLKTYEGVTVNALLQTKMLIQSHKEQIGQIEESVTDVLPIFRMQLLNAISVKAEKDTQMLMDKLSDLANDSIKENTKGIVEMTKQLEQNRTKEVIKSSTLIEANKLLCQALTEVIDGSGGEAIKNIEIANQIQESIDSLHDTMGRRGLIKENKVSINKISKKKKRA